MIEEHFHIYCAQTTGLQTIKFEIKAVKEIGIPAF